MPITQQLLLDLNYRNDIQKCIYQINRSVNMQKFTSTKLELFQHRKKKHLDLVKHLQTLTNNFKKEIQNPCISIVFL